MTDEERGRGREREEGSRDHDHDDDGRPPERARDAPARASVRVAAGGVDSRPGEGVSFVAARVEGAARRPTVPFERWARNRAAQAARERAEAAVHDRLGPTDEAPTPSGPPSTRRTGRRGGSSSSGGSRSTARSASAAPRRSSPRASGTRRRGTSTSR
jgi:hypothetical protein